MRISPSAARSTVVGSTSASASSARSPRTVSGSDAARWRRPSDPVLWVVGTAWRSSVVPTPGPLLRSLLGLGRPPLPVLDAHAATVRRGCHNARRWRRSVSRDRSRAAPARRRMSRGPAPCPRSPRPAPGRVVLVLARRPGQVTAVDDEVEAEEPVDRRRRRGGLDRPPRLRARCHPDDRPRPRDPRQHPGGRVGRQGVRALPVRKGDGSWATVEVITSNIELVDGELALALSCREITTAARASRSSTRPASGCRACSPTPRSG